VRDIASVVGKLISLEPALGRSVLVGTRLATIQIVVAIEVSDASRRQENPWNKWIEVENDTFAALHNVWLSAAEWNGCPIKCLHTGITLSSVLPIEATASLDRKIPARRLYDRQAIMASNASDFAVASYSIEGLPEFSFSSELTLEERGESSSTCNSKDSTSLGRVRHDRSTTGTGNSVVVDGQSKCVENASERVRQDSNHEASVGHF
jgi:hypothetical protein